MDNIRLLYIDLFCGAGGTSTGVEKANYKERKCAKVIACVNHDANAIASHAANHPEAQHYTEDMRTLDLRPLAEHTAEMRRMYPMAKVVLWASLECTNFSRAKGGQPRDADSRTLAEHLFRYIEALTPDYIQIENVEEFMSWGDLDENGKPIATATYYDYTAEVDGHPVPLEILAENDGLTVDDFKAWFAPIFAETDKKYPQFAGLASAVTIDFAIIHFTKRRY